MINGVGNVAGVAAGAGATAGKAAGAGGAGASSFAETLRNSIDEVTRLQQDASRAVEDLMTGKADDVSGVMTAMEKSDLAFKTLLAIRSKLMDAYEDVKNMQI